MAGCWLLVRIAAFFLKIAVLIHYYAGGMVEVYTYMYMCTCIMYVSPSLRRAIML